MFLSRSPLSARRHPVRLACIRHAASVDPEPGSNSSSKWWSLTPGTSTFAHTHITHQLVRYNCRRGTQNERRGCSSRVVIPLVGVYLAGGETGSSLITTKDIVSRISSFVKSIRDIGVGVAGVTSPLTTICSIPRLSNLSNRRAFSFSTSPILKLDTAGIAVRRRQKIEGGSSHHSMHVTSIGPVYRYR